MASAGSGGVGPAPGGGPGRAWQGLAAQQLAHAQQQLVEAEGLAQVVVAAGLEAQHHVGGRGAGRQKKHGQAGLRAPQLAHHPKAIEAGQHHLGQQQVGRGELAGAQARAAVGVVRHGVARARQRIAQQARQRGFIFE